jgi:hypothetical protein
MRRAIAIAICLAASGDAASADDCFQGDVTAKTDKDLAVLAGVTCLNGTLSISDDVTSLRPLKKLVSIDGSLRIHHTRKLTSLAGLDHLETLTGSLSIGGPKLGVPGLRNIDGLNKLEEIGGSLSIRGGYIFIPGNSLLAPIDDVTGLRSLERVTGDVTLFDVNAFRGLNALVEIEGTLTISHSGMKHVRGFAKLERIKGSFVLQANDRLTSIRGLGAVKTVEGDVVAGCPNRNAVLTEKALRAWTDKRDVEGNVVFIGADVPHDLVDDPCRGH